VTTRPGAPWRRVLKVLATSAVVLGAVAAGASAGPPSAIRATSAAGAAGPVATAGRLHAAVPACSPKASSLRPSGPPQVTPGSYMATIRARGHLIAGVDQSTYHFGFFNPLSQNIEGFDIDMIRAVAQAIFGNPDQVVYKAISDAQRIPDILSGTVDIVAHTMTITCPRLQQVDFSSVYFDAAQRVLVLKNSPVEGLFNPGRAGLRGQKVCATATSDSLVKITDAKAIPVSVPYWTDCLVLLQQGDVAAISTDDSILAGLAAQDPWTKLVGPPLTDEPYGLAISKQHTDFVRFVNAVLQQLRTNGRWAASYLKWIGTPVPAPPAAHYAG
jgi:polar amino acid transport system substrate-binding protein